MMVFCRASLVSLMSPLPEISITQDSIKHTATVMMSHIVPFALQDCLNNDLLNMSICLLASAELLAEILVEIVFDLRYKMHVRAFQRTEQIVDPVPG